MDKTGKYLDYLYDNNCRIVEGGKRKPPGIRHARGLL